MVSVVVYSCILINISKILHRGPSFWSIGIRKRHLRVEFPSITSNLMLDNGNWVGVHSTFYEGNVYRSLQNDRRIRGSGACTWDKNIFLRLFGQWSWSFKWKVFLFIVPKRSGLKHVRKWISETWKRDPSLLYLQVRATLW